MQDPETPTPTDSEFRVPGSEFPWRRILSVLGPVLALAVVYLILVPLTQPTFTTLGNLKTIARQSTTVGIAALGMTLVIIAGGIDLSVGSTIALTTVVVAWILQYTPLGPGLSAVGGVATGAFVGFVIGVLITQLRVVPFIVTLGMMLIIRGLAKGIAREQKIDVDTTWLNRLLATTPAWHGPPGVWIMLFLAVLVICVLRFTAFGRHVFAVGSNEQTARLCGVPVDQVKICVYTLNGMFAGLAGLMQFSRLTVGDPTVAIGKELDVIAAVVIGGGSLAGGEGSILGSLIGAFIMTVIASGCAHFDKLPNGRIGLWPWVREIVTGVIIILAVAIDGLRRRRSR